MNAYEASNPTQTAKRMIETHARNYRYTAYDRALDHAQSYSSASYNYKFWMDVSKEILRIQRERLKA